MAKTPFLTSFSTTICLILAFLLPHINLFYNNLDLIQYHVLYIQIHTCKIITIKKPSLGNNTIFKQLQSHPAKKVYTVYCPTSTVVFPKGIIFSCTILDLFLKILIPNTLYPHLAITRYHP